MKHFIHISTKGTSNSMFTFQITFCSAQTELESNGLFLSWEHKQQNWILKRENSLILKRWFWCVRMNSVLSEVGHFCIREGGIHINAVGYEPTKIISAHSTKITPFKWSWSTRALNFGFLTRDSTLFFFFLHFSVKNWFLYLLFKNRFLAILS